MGSVDELSYAPLSCHVMSCSAMPCKQHATTAKSIYSVASAAQRKISCHNNAYIQCCRCCHAHPIHSMLSLKSIIAPHHWCLP